MPDIDLFRISQPLGASLNTSGETDNYAVRGDGQHHIIFSDITRSGVDDMHRQIIGGQFLKRASDRLYTALNVCL